MNLKLKARIIERFGSQIQFAHTIHEDESLVSKVVRGWRPLSTEKKAECHKQSFLGSRVYGDIVNVPASAADYPKRSAGEYVGWKRLLGDGNLHMKSHRWMTFV
jgi:hypothetical protein